MSALRNGFWESRGDVWGVPYHTSAKSVKLPQNYRTNRLASQGADIPIDSPHDETPIHAQSGSF
jgi:hypothetical protein